MKEPFLPLFLFPFLLILSPAGTTKVDSLSGPSFLKEITIQTTHLIGNGAIRRIVESSPEEKRILTQLEKIDRYPSAVRHALQKGETLPESPSWIEEELYASI